jgi:hypothetical protein
MGTAPNQPSDRPLSADQPAATPVAKGGYASASEALKSLGASFNTWTTSLTATSIQMCYAVVGADWIVFSPLANLRKNHWAIASLCCVLAAITVNLITAYMMSEWHRLRYGYAESDWGRWQREYEVNSGIKSSWPASCGMEVVAAVTRFLKFGLPLAGGILLAIGAARK